MLKRLSLAIAGIFAMVATALGAGTISLSLSQQLDNQGRPLNGGKLYFYVAGTLTPQNAYQDSSLTLPHPWPIELDSAGRVPQFFLADGEVKIRLTNSAGVVQIAADNILVIGPSAGGGGGGSSVDATTILATGDLKVRYGTGALTGWVRANGRTIGSATSGASERANADTQSLFEYLWNTDANLSVSSGRGASANADWSANKTIALPDWRGRAIAALDDMGNSAAGRLTASYFGATATTLGAAGGAESHTLTTAQLPSHSHTGTTDSGGAHTHYLASDAGGTEGGLSSSNYVQYDNNYANDWSYTLRGTTTSPTRGLSSSDGSHTHTFTTGSTGSGSAHNNVQPTMLATIYLKL